MGRIRVCWWLRVRDWRAGASTSSCRPSRRQTGVVVAAAGDAGDDGVMLVVVVAAVAVGGDAGAEDAGDAGDGTRGYSSVSDKADRRRRARRSRSTWIRIIFHCHQSLNLVIIIQYTKASQALIHVCLLVHFNPAYYIVCATGILAVVPG